MDQLGIVKSWMAEHVFVTIALAVAITLLVVQAISQLAHVRRHMVYNTMFHVAIAFSLLIGVFAMGFGMADGVWKMVELGAGCILAALLTYFFGLKHAHEHKKDHDTAKKELKDAKATVERLKEHPAIRVLVHDQQTGAADSQKKSTA